MTMLVLGNIILRIPATSLLTSVLSLTICGSCLFGCGYACGQFSLRAPLSLTSLMWIGSFFLVGISALLYAIFLLFLLPAPQIGRLVSVEALLAIGINALLDSALLLVLLAGLRQRYPLVSMWQLLVFPAFVACLCEGGCIHQVLVSIQLIQDAFVFSAGYEIVVLLTLLVFAYGWTAMVHKESDALVMLPGLMLLLVAPVVAVLGGLAADHHNVVLDGAGWYLVFHLVGLIFIFLGVFPSPKTSWPFIDKDADTKMRTVIPAHHVES